MLKNYDLSFQSGSILTGRLLENMYSFPKNLIQYAFLDLSEGIVSGLQLYNKDDRLFISKGIYHHNEKLYLLTDDREILPESDTFESGVKYCTFFQESFENTDENIHICELKLRTLKISDVPKESEILFSFYGNPQLPHFCEDIFSDNFDMLSLRQSVYGTVPTFSNYLFKLISRLIIGKNNNAMHPLDYVILSEISAKGNISVDMMKIYIETAGMRVSENIERRELMHLFTDSVRKLKGTAEISQDNKSDSSDIDNSIWF